MTSLSEQLRDRNTIAARLADYLPGLNTAGTWTTHQCLGLRTLAHEAQRELERLAALETQAKAEVASAERKADANQAYTDLAKAFHDVAKAEARHARLMRDRVEAAVKSVAAIDDQASRDAALQALVDSLS